MWITLREAVTGMLHLLWLLPIFIFYAGAAAMLAARLKIRPGWLVGYTRKSFHFLIFTGAAAVQMLFGFPGVLLFGCIVSLCVLLASIRGNRSGFYKAIAREKDIPHQTFFILIPLISTALGGVVSNLLFGEYAVFGYWAAGWGDAAAEPVGTKWGKHVYRVPSLYGVPASRSLEGSLSVFLVGTAVCLLYGLVLGSEMPALMLQAGLCGMAGALVEAFSNHGLDNLTVQIAVSGTAFLLAS
jgi:phytol kinase